jgi:Zn-dependent peptidase ImmA (M78 family)
LTPKLALDRIAIEESGPSPESLALAVLAQLGPVSKAIPIVAIAKALDIIEIRYEALESFEGALLTTAERDVGSILINANSNNSAQRRRFTLAHELGHFLNTWHTPHNETGFMCAKTDIRFGGFQIKPGLSRHEVQELEANRFAIELLAPRQRVIALSNDDASVKDVLGIATELELSKEAAARRYFELHPAKIAVVFTQNGQFKYSATSSSCSRLAVQKGARFLSALTHLPRQISFDEIEVDLPVINGKARSALAEAETYHQESGHAFTILNFEKDSENEEDDGMEDTFDRFSRF